MTSNCGASLFDATCEVCGRRGNALESRAGGDDVPLGPVERCEACGRMACPDCLHELDCCYCDTCGEKREDCAEWCGCGKTWAERETEASTR